LNRDTTVTRNRQNCPQQPIRRQNEKRHLTNCQSTSAHLYLSACTVESLEEKQAKEEQARKAHLAEEAAKRNQIIAELKTSHNADDTWDKGSIAWTAELQDRLIRPDGRPIAGIARLRDVEKWDEQYRIYLVQDEVEEPGVEFRLRCFRPEGKVREPISRFTRNIAYESPEYAFVAKIRTVRRNDVLDVRVHGGEEGGSSLDVRTQFVAEGECVALKELIQEKPPGSTIDQTGVKRNR
jgi:hypothetical protein